MTQFLLLEADQAYNLVDLWRSNICMQKLRTGGYEVLKNRYHFGNPLIYQGALITEEQFQQFIEQNFDKLL